jgi:hypothetical protein
MRKGYRAKVARVNANRQENASIPAACGLPVISLRAKAATGTIDFRSKPDS